jgi:hypothetical protein
MRKGKGRKKNPLGMTVGKLPPVDVFARCLRFNSIFSAILFFASSSHFG